MKRNFWGCALLIFGAAVSSFSAGADTLSTIRQSGEIRVGHRESSPPFSFLDGAGSVGIGYSVEQCLHIVNKVKTELKMPSLKVRYVAVKTADRIAAVRDNRIDLECGSTTNAADRRKDVSFSYTIFVAGARLMVKKGSGATDLRSLRGKAIAVTERTTTEATLQRINNAENLQIRLVTVKDHAEGFAKMVSGEVAAVANDDALLAGLVSRTANPSDYELIGKFLSIEPYGIMYRKNDPVFERLVDLALSEAFANGELRKSYSKWFESGPFTLPMNVYLRESLNVPSRYSGL